MTATLTAPAPDYSQPLPLATFSITASRAAELAANGQMVPWQGVLAVEGVPTGDMRQIEIGALRWAQLPLPLMAQFENPVGGMGHDGAVLAGRIDDIVRIDENRVWARGLIDPSAPGGPNLINALDKMLMRGVSVDLDDVTVTQLRSSDGKPRRNIVDARIRGATVTPFQAIVEAEISLDTEALAASGPAVLGQTARVTTPISFEESLIELLSSNLVASGKIPVDPPLAWFERRKFDRYTDLTITPAGQVFGHVAAWGACHISFRRCEPVPRSQTNYSAFRTGKVLTAEGVEVRTGPLVMDTVHPDLLMMASDSQAFYAHTGCTVADLIPYEDEFGIAVVGAIRPDVAPQQLRALRGSDVSPDWRTVNGRPRECVALLAVNNSGFKPLAALAASGGKPMKRFVAPGGVAAALDPDGEVLALVASGGALANQPSDCTEDTFTAERRSAATAALLDRFGSKPRIFHHPAPPPKVRSFRLAQFHGGGSHNQDSHGNWAGGGSGGKGGSTHSTLKDAPPPKPPTREDREEAARPDKRGLVPALNTNWDSDNKQLDAYLEYRYGDDTYEVSVRGYARDGEYEADVVVHNIGGPDGVRVSSGVQKYNGNDSAGRKAVNSWIQSKLNETLDKPDDELSVRSTQLRPSFRLPQRDKPPWTT